MSREPALKPGSTSRKDGRAVSVLPATAASSLPTPTGRTGILECEGAEQLTGLIPPAQCGGHGLMSRSKNADPLLLVLRLAVMGNLDGAVLGQADQLARGSSRQSTLPRLDAECLSGACSEWR
jgi:hypothetical protein